MMPALRWHVGVNGAGLVTKYLGGAHSSKVAAYEGKERGLIMVNRCQTRSGMRM
jgi:hypothetical protein